MPGGYERLIGNQPTPSAVPPRTTPPAGTGTGFHRLTGVEPTITTVETPQQRTSKPEDFIPDLLGMKTAYRAVTQTNPAYVAQETKQGIVDTVTGLPAALSDAVYWPLERGWEHAKSVLASKKSAPPYPGGPATAFVEEKIRPAVGNKVKPENIYDRTIGNTMRLLTGNVSGAFGVRALALRFLRRGGDTSTRLGGLLKDIAETDPKKLAAVESAWAAAAGGASGMVEQATDSRTAALFTELTMLVGGPAALEITTNLAKAFFNREIFRQLNDEQIRRIVAGTVQEVAAKDPRFTERLQGWEKAVQDLGLDPETIHGVQPDAGAISGDPGLQGLASQARQRGFLEGDEAARAERFDERLQSKAGARVEGEPGAVRSAAEAESGRVRAVAEGVVREPTDAVAAATAAKAEADILAKMGGETMDEALDEAVRQADSKARTALEGLGPQVDAYTAGKVFQDSFDAQETLLAEAVQPAYQRFSKELGGERVSTQGVLREIEDMVGEVDPIAGGEAIPKVVGNILKDEEWTQGETTFSRMVKVRSAILDEIRSARGKEGASDQYIRNLTRIRKGIDDALSDVDAASPVHGWREVQDFYRRGKERLDQGRIARMTQPGRHGEALKMYPSEVAEDFLRADAQTGAKERMDAFAKAIGGQEGIGERVFTGNKKGPGQQTRIDTAAVPGILPDPFANEAMQEFMLGKLADYATDPVKGFDRTRAQRWIREHQTQIKMFPELKAKLANLDEFIGNQDARVTRVKALVEQTKKDLAAGVKGAAERHQFARDMLDEATALAKRTTDDFEKSALASVLRSDPGREIDAIVEAPNRVQRVKELRAQTLLAGDEAAWKGAQKAVWERLLADAKSGRSTPGRSLMFDEEKVREILERNGDVIEAVWGDAAPAQKQFLSALATAVGANTRSGAAGIGRGVRAKVLGVNVFDNLNHLVSAMTSRVYAFQRGVVSGRYLVTESILRVIGNQTTRLNDQAIDRLLMDALTDPKVALEMINAAKPRTPEGLNKALNAAIYTWQARYQDAKRGPEQRK